jgi:hypothetical protein
MFTRPARLGTDRERGEAIMRLSKAGLLVCGVYTAFFLLLDVSFYFVPWEFNLALVPISVFPVAIIFLGLKVSVGLQRLPFDGSWLSIYVYYFVSLILLYLLALACASGAMSRRLTWLNRWLNLSEPVIGSTCRRTPGDGPRRFIGLNL